jgi:hypothetical protein
MNIPLGITTLQLSRTQLLLLFLAIGFVGYNGYDYVQQSRAVTDAVTVEATVSNTEILRDDDGRNQIQYVPDVVYTYQYRGETYTSDKVFPGVSDFNRGYYDRSKAESIVGSYKPGTEVQAYVMPDAPSNAFLVREQGSGPLWGIGFGVLGILLIVLAGMGSQNAGQADPQSTSDTRSSPAQGLSWVQRNSEMLHRVSKRLAGVCLAAFFASMIALVFSVLSATRGLEGPQPEVQTDLFGPVGLSALAALVFYIGTIVSVCLYGLWSFSEYRQLRRGLDEPKPPSPFRHPSRLATVLGGDHDELNEYGRQVRLTGFVFGIVLFLTAILAYVVYTAG